MTRRPSRPWIALVLLTGLNLCNYLDRYVLPAVVTPLERDLHLSDTKFATVLTIFMVGYFATAPLFGYLGDRWPRRWLIFLGVLVWCAGTALSGVAHGLVSLLCFRILVGVGEASYGTLSPSWIADLYPSRTRNNALSLFYVAIPVGSALGFILGGLIATHLGWREAFYLAGVPGVVLAIAVLFAHEPERGAADSPQPAAAGEVAETSTKTGWLAAAKEYLGLFGLREYRLVVLGYVAQTFAQGGFGAWAPAFLQRRHHMSLSEADTFFGGALVVTGLLATIVGGAWGTAWNRRSRAGYAGVLALSGLAAIPVSFGAFLLPGLGEAKAALVAAMFFIFLTTGPVNTLILETVPITARASAMAASIFAIHLFGDLWSPQIVGWLSDRTGNLQTAILWTLPAAIIVCAMAWTRLAVVQLHLRIRSSMFPGPGGER